MGVGLRMRTVTDAESGATCQLKLMHSSLVGSAGQVQVDDFMAQYIVIPCRQAKCCRTDEE